MKLGFLNLVRDIVVKLSQNDRADVVSQVTPRPPDQHGLRHAVASQAAFSTQVGHALDVTEGMFQAVCMMQTTVGLLGESEFKVVSDINNALITGGYTKEATAVGGVCFSCPPQASISP